MREMKDQSRGRMAREKGRSRSPVDEPRKDTFATDTTALCFCSFIFLFMFFFQSSCCFQPADSSSPYSMYTRRGNKRAKEDGQSTLGVMEWSGAWTQMNHIKPLLL